MKEYNKPTLEEVKVEIEDIVAASNKLFGANMAGDCEFDWPWERSSR